MGVGYIVIAPGKYEKNITRICNECEIDVHNLGYVAKGERRVLLRPKDITYTAE